MRLWGLELSARVTEDDGVIVLSCDAVTGGLAVHSITKTPEIVMFSLEGKLLLKFSTFSLIIFILTNIIQGLSLKVIL